MIRISALILTLLGLIMLVTVSLAQELSSWERDIYYESVEKACLADADTDAEAEAIINSLTSKYGISQDTLESIMEKGMDREPTAREWEIYDDVSARTDDGLEENLEVYRELERKYNKSTAEMCELVMRCSYWDF